MLSYLLKPNNGRPVSPFVYRRLHHYALYNAQQTSFAVLRELTNDLMEHLQIDISNTAQVYEKCRSMVTRCGKILFRKELLEWREGVLH
jgi:hypothetical protein